MVGQCVGETVDSAEDIRGMLEGFVRDEDLKISDWPIDKYSVVVIDPPWPMKKIKREVRPKQRGFDYQVLSVEEIGGLDVPGILDAEGIVFLWTTQKYLPDAFTILEKWGLRYRFTMVWHKPGGIQIWNYPQFNGEFVVVGTKGKYKFTSCKAFNVVFNAPRAGHSVKPEEFYDLLKRVTDGPRIDIFNRRIIDGFDRWGDEAPNEQRNDEISSTEKEVGNKDTGIRGTGISFP